jgi:hypothetical protein
MTGPKEKKQTEDTSFRVAPIEIPLLPKQFPDQEEEQDPFYVPDEPFEDPESKL